MAEPAKKTTESGAANRLYQGVLTPPQGYSELAKQAYIDTYNNVREKVKEGIKKQHNLIEIHLGHDIANDEELYNIADQLMNDRGIRDTSGNFKGLNDLGFGEQIPSRDRAESIAKAIGDAVDDNTNDMTKGWGHGVGIINIIIGFFSYFFDNPNKLSLEAMIAHTAADGIASETASNLKSANLGINDADMKYMSDMTRYKALEKSGVVDMSKETVPVEPPPAPVPVPATQTPAPVPVPATQTPAPVPVPVPATQTPAPVPVSATQTQSEATTLVMPISKIVDSMTRNVMKHSDGTPVNETDINIISASIEQTFRKNTAISGNALASKVADDLLSNEQTRNLIISGAEDKAKTDAVAAPAFWGAKKAWEAARNSPSWTPARDSAIQFTDKKFYNVIKDNGLVASIEQQLQNGGGEKQLNLSLRMENACSAKNLKIAQCSFDERTGNATPLAANANQPSADAKVGKK